MARATLTTPPIRFAIIWVTVMIPGLVLIFRYDLTPSRFGSSHAVTPWSEMWPTIAIVVVSGLVILAILLLGPRRQFVRVDLVDGVFVVRPRGYPGRR